MTQIKHTFRHIPYFVIFFPAFTVLVLTATNLGQSELSIILRPLLFSTLFGLALCLFGLLIFRDLHQAGILALFLEVFLLTYGHFYNLMEDRVIGGWVIGRYFFVLIIWGVFFSALTIFVILKFRANTNSTLILNTVTLAITLLQIGRITAYEVKAQINDHSIHEDQNATLLHPENPSAMPDVYFIILDQYARSDALMAEFEYDNHEFIDNLREIGFWVADCSRSNYAFTVMSLSSQLNMAYVEDLTDEPSLKSTTSLIRNNKVHRAFEEIGYTTIAFDMGFPWGNFKGSDVYYDESMQNLHNTSLDPFEMLYLRSTLGILLFTDNVDIGRQITQSDLEQKAERTWLILEVLPEINTIPGPKFIHAHIITPHPPYLFNADGTLNRDAEDTSPKEGYPTQLEFIEPRIVDVIQQIIENTEQQPIIILQGDHGFFDKKYATSNLLALYLPGSDGEDLDHHMTLINVFPFIFNRYFNADIEYLPDLSYYHSEDWYQSVLMDEWNPACKTEP